MTHYCPANGALNPSFETQEGGYTFNAAEWWEGTDHVRQNGAGPHTGMWGLYSYYRGSGTAATLSAIIPVLPNTTYTVGVWIYRQNVASPTGSAYLDMNNIAGEVTLSGTVDGQWQYLETTWNSGSRTSVQLRLVTENAPNRDFWFDDVTFTAQVNTTHRTYYAGGGLRVRTPVSDQVYYVLGDHLGSTSVTANADGTLAARALYSPWGETRYSTGTIPTDARYTGQKQTLGAGLEWLYFYNARWYDAMVGRFLQADTIVPGAGSGQAFNRYSYVRNNPMNRVDPSGYLDECAALGDADDTYACENPNDVPLTYPNQPDEYARTHTSDKDAEYKFGGSEVKKLYDKMVAAHSGWWYADGHFGIEEFVGIVLFIEANGEIAIDDIIPLANQELFGGGMRDPYCISENCMNGVFNYLATTDAFRKRLYPYITGDVLKIIPFGWPVPPKRTSQAAKDIIARAREIGTAVLDASKASADSWNTPSKWGNNPALWTWLVTNQYVENGSIKPQYIGPNALITNYKSGACPFFVFSVRQITNLTNLGAPMTEYKCP